MLKEVEILKGQTLADIAIQETGHFEGLFDIAINNGIGMTDEIASGNVLDIDENIINTRLHRFILLENIKPATAFGYIPEGGEEPVLGGIGYMAIGLNFIVS